MARITVEDCLKKIDSQSDLVLLAKERTAQLNSGEKPLVSEENDKNTVIALREIGDGKVSIKTIEDSAINKLRKVQNEPNELEELEIESDDDFNKIYKGEISKSGAAILPSKRVRKIPEKIISKKLEEEVDAAKAELNAAKEELNAVEEKPKEQDSSLNENKTE